MKSKKAKANSAAKTDGASVSPQQGSGESSTTAVLSSYMFVPSQSDACISEIKHEPFWPSTFALLSAVEAVSSAGFKPELIASALDGPVGGRLRHALDSYSIVTDDKRVIKTQKNSY